MVLKEAAYAQTGSSGPNLLLLQQIATYNGYLLTWGNYRMTIDLNKHDDLNFANVRKLLASGRDDIDLEIRVTYSGIVFLSTVTGPENLDEICFRIGEMNMSANDKEFIGPDAAAVTDDKLVDQVLRTITKYWANKPPSLFAELEAY